jgi:hypothetical protein
VLLPVSDGALLVAEVGLHVTYHLLTVLTLPPVLVVAPVAGPLVAPQHVCRIKIFTMFAICFTISLSLPRRYPAPLLSLGQEPALRYLIGKVLSVLLEIL